MIFTMMPGVVITLIINEKLFYIMFQLKRIIMMTRIFQIQCWDIVRVLMRQYKSHKSYCCISIVRLTNWWLMGWGMNYIKYEWMKGKIRSKSFMMVFKNMFSIKCQISPLRRWKKIIVILMYTEKWHTLDLDVYWAIESDNDL